MTEAEQRRIDSLTPEARAIYAQWLTPEAQASLKKQRRWDWRFELGAMTTIVVSILAVLVLIICVFSGWVGILTAAVTLILWGVYLDNH